MSPLANMLLLTGLALAAPSRTSRAPAGATHTIAVGKPFAIEPNNIFAQPGDVLEFHFATGHNAVVQSSFDAPCTPLRGGFSSGAFAVAAGQPQSADVFVVPVPVQQQQQPMWFYLAAGDACSAHGMVGVVNADPQSAQNIGAFVAAAQRANGTVAAGAVRGGVVVPNPKPDTGI